MKFITHSTLRMLWGVFLDIVSVYCSHWVFCFWYPLFSTYWCPILSLKRSYGEATGKEETEASNQ